MSWWQCDSSLAHTRQYARLLLRYREAAIRTRCFSHTPSQLVQDDKEHGGKRPAGMSNLEWMHVQHDKRWQRRLTEDPYGVMFGPSNAMLAGKGLKDWEWIRNSFPKWMLRDIEGFKDYVPEAQSDSNKGRAFSRANVSFHTEGSSRYPKPSTRTTPSDREDMIGVASPLDLRRPREQSHGTIVGIRQPFVSTFNTEPQGAASDNDHISIERLAKYTDADLEKVSPTIPSDPDLDNTEATKGKGSFIGQSVALKLGYRSTHAKPQMEDSDLTQNIPQKNATQKLASLPDSCTALPAVSEEEACSISSFINRTNVPVPGITDATESSKAFGSHKQPSLIVQSRSGDLKRNPRVPANESDSLLEDDIDFRGANEIRAAFKARKRKFLSTEQKISERQQLEQSFQAAQDAETVHSILQAKTLNDQTNRRLERALRKPEDKKPIEKPLTVAEPWENTNGPVDPVEFSIKRMAKWLEQSGEVFASYFWQDPIEEADASKSQLFIDQVIVRIRKGRITMRQVIEDLENDVPVSKPLLKRMRKDEDLLDSAMQGLRLRSEDGKAQGLSPTRLRAIDTLRLKFQDTEQELETAYASLRKLGGVKAITSASPALKRRLVIASRITHKNAHLTRHLIWSLQARLEDPHIKRNILINYKVVVNSMLTLMDTQMALIRLVDRVMSIYGVEVPKIVNDLNSLINNFGSEANAEPSKPCSYQDQTTTSHVDKIKLLSDMAAEEYLANEVKTQKTAMRGLSDDGYTHVTRPIQRKPFEESTPLDHSLFRPFGPVLAGLSNNDSADASMANEVANSRLEDKTLVAEAKGGSSKDVSFPLLQTTHTKDVNRQSSTSSAETNSANPSPTAVEVETLPVQRASESSTQLPGFSKLPTHYTMLFYDSKNDTMSVATSTSPPPRETTPVMSLPFALAALDAPTKFIPYITEDFEIVTAKSNMLVLRNAPSDTDADSQKSQNFAAHPSNLLKVIGKDINAIHGTTRLIPADCARPAKPEEQFKKESEERMYAACKNHGDEISKHVAEERATSNVLGPRKNKVNVGTGSVIKTAIWAAATCYVFGVIGEIMSGL